MAVVLGLGSVFGAYAAPSALPDCSATVRTDDTNRNPGYVACLGAFAKNMDKQLDDIYAAMAKAGDGWSKVAESKSYVSSESFKAAMNPFSENESDGDGSIDFDSAQTGWFVLGLKQGDGFSLYLFDGRNVKGGISSIEYDTLGVKTKSDTAFSLSHAGYFGAVTPVPEPSAYAMMLAGLAVVGFALKRRKG
jgi:hypothetical protein